MGRSVSTGTKEDRKSTGGNFLSEDGTYHCNIKSCKDGEMMNGKPFDGFTVEFEVLAGTVDQAGRTFSVQFWDPDLSKGEASQKWSMKKQAAFLLAADLMTPDCEGDIDVELSDAVNRQVVITMERETDDDGNAKCDDKGRPWPPRLAWDNLYHVDDPRAEKYVLHEPSLKLLPPELRHDKSYFADADYGSNGSTKTSTAPPVDVNDLF